MQDTSLTITKQNTISWGYCNLFLPNSILLNGIPVLREENDWPLYAVTFISCTVAANLEKALQSPAAYRHPAFMVFQLVWIRPFIYIVM